MPHIAAACKHLRSSLSSLELHIDGKAGALCGCSIQQAAVCADWLRHDGKSHLNQPVFRHKPLVAADLKFPWTKCTMEQSASSACRVTSSVSPAQAAVLSLAAGISAR